jgi:hypothetical protein
MFNIEYIGNLHIHSRYSDGSAGIDEIALVAEKAGLDFVCLNDHAHMFDALPIEKEGQYGNILVLIGQEIGKRYHHYLAYGLDKRLAEDQLNPQQIIDWVNNNHGFGFLAHPFENGMPFMEKSKAYTWNDLSVTGYTGICLWNFSSRWKERVKSLGHGLFFLLFKSRTLKGPSKRTISFWDRLCQKSRIVAVGGSDAHGSSLKIGPLRLIPLTYHYVFQTINIHILLRNKLPKNFDNAKNEIYLAMKSGRLFIANDKLAAARGFRFYFLSEDGFDLVMGEEGPFSRGRLMVELPKLGEIQIIKDGKLVATYKGLEGVYPIDEKGVYRVEVYLHFSIFGRRPWIFSNPIYLR